MRRAIVLFFALAAPAAAGPKLDAEAASRNYKAILRAAEANAGLGKGALTGDALFDLYLQTVLTGAIKGGEETMERELRAGFAALGLFLDDTALKNPLAGKAFANIETADLEANAAKVRGRPTCAGRSDTALHFAVSAALAAALGEGIARMAGVQKEMSDMQSLDHGTGSGYSFSDLAANEAGIRLVTWLLEKPAERLKRAEAKFSQKTCVPSLEGLPDGLRTDEFDDKYGPVGSDRYEKRMKGIQERMDALPLYQEEGR
ncbi:MAG: hypothetical protein HYY18_22095 [Planctomycetes bacterium]|nr:hypothetical protein [Planctomycetota bacterium]